MDVEFQLLKGKHGRSDWLSGKISETGSLFQLLKGKHGRSDEGPWLPMCPKDNGFNSSKENTAVLTGLQ